MKKTMIFLAILFVFTAAFANERERSMMKTPIFYALPSGEIGTAEYWQLQLGTFEVSLPRTFPGIGQVAMEGNMNVALMSGGYLEGSGFGDAPTHPQIRSQRINSFDINFAVKRNGRYETIIRVDTLDFVFWGASMAQVKGANAPEDLFVHIENTNNTFHARAFNLAVFVNERGDLRRSYDVEPVAISFTREGARRGFQANMAEANR